MLDVCLRRKLITDEMHREGKQLLDRIVAMLTIQWEPQETPQSASSFVEDTTHRGRGMR